MTVYSCGRYSEDSSDQSGETWSGPDAEVATGSLGPHDLTYAGFGADGSSLDLPSDGLEDDEAGTLNPIGGDGGQVANNISRRPSVDKVDEEGEDKVRGDIKGSGQKGKGKKDPSSDGKDLKLNEKDSDKEEEEDLKLKEEEERKEEERKKEERANRNALLLLTALLVLAMPFVVWRSINQPELLLWRFSLLLCFCCIIWTRLLDVGMNLQTVLFIFSNSFLLALYADGVGDTGTGAVIAHLNSYLAVGILGYALAERRQRDGTEVSAAAAVARYPSDESKAENLLFFQTLGGLYIKLATLGFAAFVAWLVWHRADFPVEQLSIYVFFPLSCILMLWIMYVGGMLLQGALIQEPGLLSLLVYLFSVTFFSTMVSVLIGEIASMEFISLVMLGFPGFLGYSLSVYTSFKLRLKLQLKVDEGKGGSLLRSSPEESDESSKPPSLESASSSAPILDRSDAASLRQESTDS
ncbi:unnamed protein product [Urochloa decumbens]|uniref:Uncharacterized protein n=1 Tax=Urochloa decumbens TaxID=240449 RepID=A0ABC9AYY7_9POAL